MQCSFLVVLFFGALHSAIAVADTKAEAIKKDRKLIEGTWRIVALEVNGDKVGAEGFSVVNGSDGTWSLLYEGREISKGTSTLDPTKKVKCIDFTEAEGTGKGSQYIGIYELGEKTRKLCFAEAGGDRPTKFVSIPGSKITLVTFEREKAK